MQIVARRSAIDKHLLHFDNLFVSKVVFSLIVFNICLFCLIVHNYHLLVNEYYK